MELMGYGDWPYSFSSFLDVAVPAVTQYNKGRAFEAVMPHGTKTGPPDKGSCLRGICGLEI